MDRSLMNKKEEMRRIQDKRERVKVIGQIDKRDWMAIERRPEWSILVLTSRLKYKLELALKWSWNYTMSHEP
jgi:hypothetical protein